MQYCPACGQQTLRPSSPKSFHCSACGFVLFLNTAAAAAAILEYQEQILLVVRAQDPEQGKLDLPGGFVDYDETTEAALLRELREELGLEPTASPSPLYFGSFPNLYPYRGMTYRVVDSVYRISFQSLPMLNPADDVADIQWVDRTQIPFPEVAFPSIRQALTAYVKSWPHGGVCPD